MRDVLLQPVPGGVGSLWHVNAFSSHADGVQGRNLQRSKPDCTVYSPILAAGAVSCQPPTAVAAAVVLLVQVLAFTLCSSSRNLVHVASDAFRCFFGS
jgi:hypothetical protein